MAGARFEMNLNLVLMTVLFFLQGENLSQHGEDRLGGLQYGEQRAIILITVQRTTIPQVRC